MAALQYPVRAPDWRLSYAGQNLTSKITGMVLEITYTDHFHGKAGDVEVKLEDKDQRWQGPWFPVQGDVMQLWIGYAGENKLDCGSFQVDDLELEGPPDVFTIRAIPAFITPSLRTPTSAGYENQTLMQIATTVAGKHGLTVVGAPNDINVSFKRVTQNRETDLAFLKRLANENDYDFTVRDKKIQFYSRPQLHAQPPVVNVVRTGSEKFQFKSKANQIYKGAQVSYQDPASGAAYHRHCERNGASTDGRYVARRSSRRERAGCDAEGDGRAARQEHDLRNLGAHGARQHSAGCREQHHHERLGQVRRDLLHHDRAPQAVAREWLYDRVGIATITELTGRLIKTKTLIALLFVLAGWHGIASAQLKGTTFLAQRLPNGATQQGASATGARRRHRCRFVAGGIGPVRVRRALRSSRPPIPPRPSMAWSRSSTEHGRSPINWSEHLIRAALLIINLPTPFRSTN